MIRRELLSRRAAFSEAYRMVTVHRIIHEHVRCPHCGKEVSWLWEMEYESPQLMRRLLLCGECEGLIDPKKRPHPSEDRPTPAAA